MPFQKGGTPEIKHVSIEALLAEYPGESNAEELIKRLARAKVAYAKKFGWSGPPFCPMQFTSLFNIKCKEVDHDIGSDGRILLCRDGTLQIEYRSKRLLERQRFTIFHEFAHLLFPDYGEFLPHHQTSQESENAAERKFETLCDVAATEMLMPIEDFTGDLKKIARLGFDAVDELRRRYLASIDATVHRLVELADPLPCCAVFLTDQKGKHDGDGPLWVKYIKMSRRFSGFVWPGTCPPRNSVAYHCYQTGKGVHVPVRETWSIKGQSKTFMVETMKLPNIAENPNYPKVAALLFPAK